jgi:phenylacetate-CoA ligase
MKDHKIINNFINKPLNTGYNDKGVYKKSFSKALKLLKRASVEIPAYKDFLQKNKININLIKSIKDFNNIPYTTKENYIFQYDIKDRSWNSKINQMHTIASSSGSTGEPVFWPREVEQEIEGAKIHEHLLNEVFDVKNNKTLIINSFGLGNWIAGMYTEFCLYLLRLKSLPFTLASPGYNQDETFKIVNNFSKYYDQTIIACHPPILKMMIENGENEGINWKKLNIKFLGAGEGFSENWRDYLLSMVNQKNPYNSFINIYGSADAGLMGFETPLSIYLRRLTSRDNELNKELFNSDRNPYLYQFDPEFKYLNINYDQEILITCDATAPLLKYNIHDKGGILDYLKVYGLNKLDTNLLKGFCLPFVYIFGRDKFMTTLYGVNIYPENIKAVLEHKTLQNFLTGRYVSEKQIDKNSDQYLELTAELKPKIKASGKIAENIKKLFILTLRELNSEYKYVESRYKNKMHPKIILTKFQDPKVFPVGKIKKMS